MRDRRYVRLETSPRDGAAFYGDHRERPDATAQPETHRKGEIRGPGAKRERAIGRKPRFRKQGKLGAAKARRRQLWLTAMALGPGLVLAEVVGSVFCRLTPSRRLHCLLQRGFQPLAL